MITFFTTAKPFEGDNKVRQVNAIRSWKAVHPDVEVLLFGQGFGYAEIARELGLVQISDVATNDFGVPRVDSMFSLAAARGRNPIQAYINCDILLLDDFLPAVKRLSFDQYLMVAQRYDVDLHTPIDFTFTDWSATIYKKAHSEGRKLSPCGIDVFLEKGRIWRDLPPMVVGRGMYDNWLIYYCRSRGIPVIDATEVVTIVHQNHDYSHIAGGKKTVEVGEEASRNLEMGGGYRYLFTIQDADWRLTAKALVRNWCRGDSMRYGEVFVVLHEKMPSVVLRIGQMVAELLCELHARWLLARRGNVLPLLKLSGWCCRRMLMGSERESAMTQ